MEKKLNKNKSSSEKRQQMLEMRSILEGDLRAQGHRVLESERKNVKDIVQQEREMFTTLASGQTLRILTGLIAS